MIFASAQKSRLSHWSPLSTAVSRVSLESLLSPPKRVQSVHRVHVATALQITAMSHCCSVHIPVIHIQRNSVFMASLSCTACVHCSILQYASCSSTLCLGGLKLSTLGEVGECNRVVRACCSLPHSPRLAAVLRPFGNVNSLPAVAGQAWLCRAAYRLARGLSDTDVHNTGIFCQ